MGKAKDKPDPYANFARTGVAAPTEAALTNLVNETTQTPSEDAQAAGSQPEAKEAAPPVPWRYKPNTTQAQIESLEVMERIFHGNLLRDMAYGARDQLREAMEHLKAEICA